MPENKTPRYSFSHDAMATFNRITVCHTDERYARQASLEAFAEIDRIEAVLSRFIPGSDICRLNAAAPGDTIPVTPETWQCLRIAEEIRQATSGAFDVTIGRFADGQQAPATSTAVYPQPLPEL